MTIDEILNVKCGDILVDATRRHALMVSKIKRKGATFDLWLSNTVDLITMMCDSDFNEISTEEMQYADQDERDLYFDVMRNSKEKTTITHYEGDNLIYAGSLLVFEERYITMLLNNVPVNGFTSHNWSVFNTFDMQNDWESSSLKDLPKGIEPRLAEKRETIHYWKCWCEYVKINNRKPIENNPDCDGVGGKRTEKVALILADMLPHVKYEIINNYIYSNNNKVWFVGTEEECDKWMQENADVYHAAGIELLRGRSIVPRMK